MSDSAAGQEGPTPDFIPGWFKPRSGNVDPGIREAVRIPEVGDHFPITFLRSNERVSPATRPQLGFTIGTTSQPGHDRFDLGVPPGYWIVRDSDGHLHNWRDEDFKEKYTRSDHDWTSPVDRESPPRRRCGAEEPKALRDNPHLPPGYAEKLTAELIDGEGWKGSHPAEGTRRALIRDAIGEYKEEHGKHPADLELADAIESALLKATIDEEAMVRGAEALTAGIEKVDPITPRWPTTLSIPIHELLDRANVIREEQEAGEAPRRILPLTERLERLVSRCQAQQATIDAMADLAVAQADLLAGKAGTVPAGTRELHIVLDHDTPASLMHAGPKFVELETQDGTNIGGFESRWDGQTQRIVIPYGRDDAWVSEVAHQAGGAVSGVFLREDPEKVMPAEECAAAVATILTGFGVKAHGDHAAEEHLEHGKHETSGQVWPKGSPEYRRVMAAASEGVKTVDDLVKALEDDVERLQGQREEARAGEGRYAEERDCAFALLRWLLPVTVAKRLD